MRFFRYMIFIVTLCLISACAGRSDVKPTLAGPPSPTPFQPQDGSASDSPYTDPAPTPIDLPTEIATAPAPADTATAIPILSAENQINPLTGLPFSDPALIDRRPMAIKVANYPRYLRPQSGLTLADNVFEYYIESGLTRFIAVFYGNDSEWVGPVRSGRYFDEHVTRMYHAFLVFKYADPREYTYFKSSDFANNLVVPGFGDCPPFHMLKGRKIEEYNNVYFNTIKWAECAVREGRDNSRQVIRNGFFSEDIPKAELLGLRMYTYYTVDDYHYWEYQPDTQQYIRYQETDDTRNNKPESYALLTDNVNGEAVHASNVVMLFVTHTFANNFDQADEVYQIDLTGSGEAYVFRDGLGIIAHWRRTNIDQPLMLIGADGNPIFLKPGITFYEVLGARSYVDQDTGEWHFHHSVP